MRIRFEDQDYTPLGKESVLECLERAGVSVPSLCRSGACQACMLRAVEGAPPKRAQQGLKAGLRNKGNFLSCVCTPTEDLVVERSDAAQSFDSRVVTVEALGANVYRVLLEKPAGFEYQAGQFVRLTRPADGIMRAYSLASLPSDELLELHVALYPDGQFSPWLIEARGEPLGITGPFGECCYLAEEPERPLLLVGTGTGLAPLIGVIKDALAAGHQGPIQLFHGSRTADGLYLAAKLTSLTKSCPQLRVYLAVLEEQGLDSVPAAPSVVKAKADLPAFLKEHTSDLARAIAYVCGNPDIVHRLKRQIFMDGCAMTNIYSDPFSPPQTSEAAN